MSAVPKKKLCWNCEGNVSKQIDNCPYCGVYLHAMEQEEETTWNPSYRVTSGQKTPDIDKEIPSPPYQISSQEEEAATTQSQDIPYTLDSFFEHLKTNLLPTFLLMAGSSFFLFSVVLFLFSYEGTLTLQWKGDHWIYFLIVGVPSLYFGWRLLQKQDSE